MSAVSRPVTAAANPAAAPATQPEGRPLAEAANAAVAPQPDAQPASERAAAPLLVELLTEELPPKALARLSEVFSERIASGLRARGLATDAAAVQAFATPRRLAVRVDAVLPRAADRIVEQKGPSVKVGLDATGQPTQALLKWAERQGAHIDQLERAGDGKQECFWYRSTAAGATLDESIVPLIEEALAALPIPKLMQYQLADGRTTVSFVRPAHGLVVLHGAQVVPATVLGLQSGRITQAHRFLGNGALAIDDARAYEKILKEEGRVIASLEERRARVATLLQTQAMLLQASLGSDEAGEALLDEVTALVELPAVYVGEFEPEFLEVPQECLILTMRTNQKYFPLFEPGGKLQSRFLIVSNMEVDDPSFIIDGNQRVVRPRLADARFFYDQDRNSSLADRVSRLDSVVYHAKLGTQGERMLRVRRIAADVARLFGVDPALAERAATLAKTDLLTGMVGEFPELQGVMGAYYARHDGEPEEVAAAIREHYQPRFAGDELAPSRVGRVLALADKLETLAGLFGIGQTPTGDKDPFALRRHALGVVRMLVESESGADHAGSAGAVDRIGTPAISLRKLVDTAFDAFGDRLPADPARRQALVAFLHERLSGWLRERGWSANEVAAVIDDGPDVLATVPARLEAVRAFSQLPEAQALAGANKRIGNLLRKARESGAASKSSAKAPADEVRPAEAVDPGLFTEEAERTLAAIVDVLGPKVDEAMHIGDYGAALSLMAQARGPVDRFFDDVMVMDENPAVRANRLALLARLRELMNRVADISRLSSA